MPVATRLVPVIEFDPFEYRIDRSKPGDPIEVDPAAWARFWRDSLADGGVTGLEPLADTWVVPVDAVRDPALLARLLAVQFDAADVPAFLATLPGPFDPKSGMNADGEGIEEHFSTLRGGVALLGERDALIAPECCGDLGNWRDWRNATLVETGSWRELWIGHPSARVRREDDGVLQVQRLTGDGTEQGAPVPVRVDDLRAGVDAAVAGLMELDTRLLAVLREQGVDALLATRMARRLAGLAEYELD